MAHADFYAVGIPSVNEVTGAPVSAWSRYVVESLGLVVNVYIIISGYFGIKTRLQSVVNFLFKVMFWRIGILAGFVVAKLWCGYVIPASSADMLRMLIPGQGDWFVASYIILMMLAPILNNYIEKSSTGSLWKFVAGFCGFQFLLPWLVGNVFQEFNGGYSVLSFIGLYFLGAAVRRSLPQLKASASQWIGGYVFVSVVAGTVMFLAVWLTVSPCDNLMRMFLEHNGPVVMGANLMLFLAFAKMKFQSKTVNSIAASAFAVYLFHMHPLVKTLYVEICNYLFVNFNTATYLVLISLFIAGMFVGVVAVDFIRRYLWSRFSQLMFGDSDAGSIAPQRIRIQRRGWA